MLLTLGAVVTMPAGASAQLGLGSLIVTMTSPAPGSTVGGTVMVAARTTVVGSLTVAGVQFKLDGVDLGAEDRTAPYAAPWDTKTAANGPHTLTAVARDVLGLRYTSNPVTVTVFNDIDPPAIAVTAPAAGSVVSGALPVTAGASDNVGVAGVQFRLDGAALGPEDRTSPYAVPWDTTGVPNGSHSLTAVARDAAGNRATAASITVTVLNDAAPPEVAITSPADGSAVAGIIAVSASASDDVEVASVQFLVDGVVLGTEDTTPPYSVDWDTATASDGSHALTAVARDAVGNSTTSDAVTVTVANAAVLRLEETDTAITYGGSWVQGHAERPWSGGTAAVTAAAGATATLRFDGTAVSWIGFRGPQVGIANVYVDGALAGTVDGYAATEEVNAVLFTATGLPSETHTLAVEATGTKNSASSDVFVVVDAFDVAGTGARGGGTPPDTTPPSVSITAPAAGATLSGIVTLAATATDGTGVAGVRFFANGVQIGPEVTASPYEMAWDTRAVADGSYTLTALARDATGNTGASAGVDVVVANATTSTRIEETSSAVTYVGAWAQGNIDRAWSGGTAAISNGALARATLRLTGTTVSWIGFRGPQAGIARVFVDGALAATVDAYAASEEVRAVLFTADGLAAGEHTLDIEVTGERNPDATDAFVVVDAFDVPSAGTGAGDTFAPGDLLISLEPGPVQWRRPDGTLRHTLTGAVPGTAEGMTFDAAGNLYVTRWCSGEPCPAGTVEKYDVRGQSLGFVGRDYNCLPHDIVFDSDGNAYVGQAQCTGAILKFAPDFPADAPPSTFAAAPENRGTFWIDLAADGCTMFYTSWGRSVKRFDVCANAQLPDFNSAPLPGDAQDLQLLPDGGVIVSTGGVISRLDAMGALVRTYQVPGETDLWAGLDLVGDRTFWAVNYATANVYRLDLDTGAVLTSFNTGTGANTVVAIEVRK